MNKKEILGSRESHSHVGLDEDKLDEARKHYLNPDDKECYLKPKSALMKVGYAACTAEQYAAEMYKVNYGIIDPLQKEALQDEIRAWLGIMIKWRKKLELVTDPMEIDTKTYSLISSHIERLSKMSGIIKPKEPEININITNLDMPVQYTEIKAIIPILVGKLRDLEGKLNVADKDKLSLSTS